MTTVLQVIAWKADSARKRRAPSYPSLREKVWAPRGTPLKGFLSCVLMVAVSHDSRRPWIKVLSAVSSLVSEEKLESLVAETGADGDLVTALGAAAAEDGCTCFGLHAGEEAVGLGAVAAVGLEGTLRHDKNSCAGENTCSNF
jgi:hypothetical protein